MSNGNYVMDMWQKLSPLPGGKFLLSQVISRKAPYFKTVSATIEELRPNYARVSMKKRRAVQNHIGTVHVIAICNLLEMAMGVCAEASIPKHLRWIPKGMSVDYTAKAGSDITGVAEINPEDWKPGDLEVKVTASDSNGTPVVVGVIKLWISEKK
ncbi:MAG: hotdog fold domain-containing protein [Pseudomonadota bacterium]|nr:hotdog fold domain-containing protein [Pseudomonadota bacterium]